MTSGSEVAPSTLRRWMAGTVKRLSGAETGVARLVAVSRMKVVDIGLLYPRLRRVASGR